MPNDNSQKFDLKNGLEFLRRYHPDIWERVKEEDIKNLLEIGYVLFKARPDLLEVTTQTRHLPFQ